MLVFRGQPLTAEQQIDFADVVRAARHRPEARVQAAGAARGRAPDRHLERRRAGRVAAPRFAEEPVELRQPALAQRQLVHESARGVLDAARRRHAELGRQHRVRRPARRLGHARRAHQGATSRAWRPSTTRCTRASCSATRPTPTSRRRRSRRRSGRSSTRIRARAARLLFVGVHARQIVGWPTAEGRMFLRRPARARDAARARLRRTNGSPATS